MYYLVFDNNFNHQIMSCCINGITMALVDAGISITNFIGSSTIALSKENNHIIDPDLETIKSSSSYAVTAWDQNGKQLLSWYRNNDNKTKEQAKQIKDYWKLIELGKQASAKIIDFQQQTIKQKLLYEMPKA